MKCLAGRLATGYWAIVLLAAPCTPAHAGILDFFGVGTAVSAIGEAAWKIYAIKVGASMGPLILLLAAVIGTMVAAWSIVKLGDSFSQTLRTAMRDDRISTEEWAIIALQGGYTIPALGLLAFVSFYLAAMVHHGYSEIINYRPPSYEQPPMALAENRKK